MQNPAKILPPYVKPGMTVMDIGCGMGIFSIGAAKIVGDEGLVIAVDLQQKILDVLRKRARRVGVAHRIRTHCCGADSLGVDEPVDFGCAFNMVHEVTNSRNLLEEVHSCLKPGGKFLVSEPSFHVSAKTFQETLDTAEQVGFELDETPRIRNSRSAVLLK